MSIVAPCIWIIRIKSPAAKAVGKAPEVKALEVTVMEVAFDAALAVKVV